MVAGLRPLGARGPEEPRSSRKRFSSARWFAIFVVVGGIGKRVGALEIFIYFCKVGFGGALYLYLVTE